MWNWVPDAIVLNVKALVGAFNQEEALVGAFSVIVQLHRLSFTALTRGRRPRRRWRRRGSRCGTSATSRPASGCCASPRSPTTAPSSRSCRWRRASSGPSSASRRRPPTFSWASSTSCPPWPRPRWAGCSTEPAARWTHWNIYLRIYRSVIELSTNLLESHSVQQKRPPLKPFPSFTIKNQKYTILTGHLNDVSTKC